MITIRLKIFHKKISGNSTLEFAALTASVAASYLEISVTGQEVVMKTSGVHYRVWTSR